MHRIIAIWPVSNNAALCDKALHYIHSKASFPGQPA